MNYELDEGDMLDWLTDAGIRKTDRISLLNLRGRRFSFASDHSCAEFVAWCREMEVEVLDLDPHRLAMSGFGSENDNDDVNRFTERLDQIKVDAGVSDLFLKVHMGRAQHEEGAEHARGATSLDDWADQRLVMTKNGAGERFLYAEGRLAEVPEFKLTHDPATRLLVAENGSRRSAKAESDGEATDLLAQVVAMLVRDTPGMNVTELKTVMKEGHGVTNNTAGSKAVGRALELGLIRKVKDGRCDRLHPVSTTNSLVRAVVV